MAAWVGWRVIRWFVKYTHTRQDRAWLSSDDLRNVVFACFVGAVVFTCVGRCCLIPLPLPAPYDLTHHSPIPYLVLGFSAAFLYVVYL